MHIDQLVLNTNRRNKSRNLKFSVCINIISQEKKYLFETDGSTMKEKTSSSTHLIYPRASRLWSSSSGGRTSPRAAAASRPPLAASGPSGTTMASRCRRTCWWSTKTPLPSTLTGEKSMKVEALPAGSG